ncbi:MAG: DNA mismatch repair protein MutL, partial [Chitinophagaceae bacterium]|nr:DNA mismatch repair protein MutL [Chitinophagaceae bacterium]
NHAVANTFENMIAKDSYPSYVLFIDLDPAQIDINVHPTKQEIKFEDEKIIYAFVQAAVKHALAQFSIAPSLDFTLNPEIQNLDAVNKPFTTEKKELTASGNLYKTFTGKYQAHKIEPNEKSELKHWKDFFTNKEQYNSISNPTENVLLQTLPKFSNTYIQLHNTYILTSNNSGFMLVHQQHAHERILYEKYIAQSHSTQPTVQKILFPVTIELATPDAILLEDLLPDIIALGYQIEPFGNNTFIIQGTPADVIQGNEKNSIELLLEQFKHFSTDIKYSKREKLIRCISRQQAIKTGTALSQNEMQTLLEHLFQCTTPNVTPSGNPTYIEFKEDYLDRMFGKI